MTQGRPLPPSPPSLRSYKRGRTTFYLVTRVAANKRDVEITKFLGANAEERSQQYLEFLKMVDKFNSENEDKW